jgi:hypothetical protein
MYSILRKQENNKLSTSLDVADLDRSRSTVSGSHRVSSTDVVVIRRFHIKYFYFHTYINTSQVLEAYKVFMYIYQMRESMLGWF